MGMRVRVTKGKKKGRTTSSGFTSLTGADRSTQKSEPLPELQVALRKLGKWLRALPRPAWFTGKNLQRIVFSRRFSQASFIVIVVLFVSSFYTPMQAWVSGRLETVNSSVSQYSESLGQPVRKRAAFFIVDEFRQRADHWLSQNSVQITNEGLIPQKGVTLHRETLDLTDYKLQFEAKIQSKAVAWVVRAADEVNYYAFKLNKAVRKGSSEYSLVRYAVTQGKRASPASPIAVPAEFAREDFNRISVRLRGDQINTLLNGKGIDYWKDSQFGSGGIGFLAGEGEEALIRKVAVSGNEDTMGLLLYGTIETIRSVRDFVGRRFAFALPMATKGQY